MQKILLTLMSLVLLMLPGIAQPVELVTNAGFELGDFSGWTHTGNDLSDTIVNNYPHSGTYAAALGAVGDYSYLTQNLPTSPGGLYDVSFWLSVYQWDTSAGFRAYWNGSLIYQFTNTVVTPWTNEGFPAMEATTTSTVLEFQVRNDPAYFYLDDVSVSQTTVPEPTTLLLLGSGLMGLAGLWRKFKK